MSTIYPQLRITDPNFNYVPAARTDIRETFRRARGELVKDKPLVPYGGNSLNKPLVNPSLNQGQFVLGVEWFELLE